MRRMWANGGPKIAFLSIGCVGRARNLVACANGPVECANSAAQLVRRPGDIMRWQLARPAAPEREASRPPTPPTRARRVHALGPSVAWSLCKCGEGAQMRHTLLRARARRPGRHTAANWRPSRTRRVEEQRATLPPSRAQIEKQSFDSLAPAASESVGAGRRRVTPAPPFANDH